MKLKVKVKCYGNASVPVIDALGDWIDLHTNESVVIKKNKSAVISLGVAMELPAGYEAHIVPRSSTFKRYGLLQTNHVGIIDNSYRGDNDIWGLPVLGTKTEVTVPEGTRLCQFKIVLSQKATPWQRIKNLFVSRIDFIEVEGLNNKDRKGFGEGTGI